MNILFVTQANPNSDGAGWEQRAAQHLRALTQLGHVTVVLPWSRATNPEEKQCKETSCIALGAHAVIYRANASVGDLTASAHLSARNCFNRIWKGIQRTPHFDARSQDADKAIYRAQIIGRFDFVFCFRIESAIWLESFLDISERPLGIVDFDDIESSMFEQTVLTSKTYSPFWTYKLRQSYRKLKRAERRMTLEWSAISICSELDAARLKLMYGVEPWVVPNGFRFSPFLPETFSNAVKILFVGSFTHVPNVNGILWFLKEIWPRVRQMPSINAELTIVGYQPPKSILAYDQSNGVNVVANAPDLAPFYDAANIVIAPLLQGSGTRIKLLEAAAHNRAIVSTTIGCEGLGFVHDKHAALANDAEAFSAMIVTLASDPEKRSQLAHAARDAAKKSFEASTIEGRMADRIRSLIEGETGQIPL